LPPARRLLPRGPLDAALQGAVWAGFAAAYEAVRGLTSDERTTALAHTHALIRLEQRLHVFVEPAIQRHVVPLRLVTGLADWSYWFAQFVVVGIVVVWVYLRRGHAYARLRDTLIATNCLGLVGYLAYPVAPPRLVSGYGFRDTFGALGSPTQHNGIVHLFANPYAAFPSVHAADALVLGVAVFRLARPRIVKLLALLWPFWVSFALVLSANHFWLDVVVGLALAAAVLLTDAALRRPRAG
jgi:membrane-associated phospholipid phosphatase